MGLHSTGHILSMSSGFVGVQGCFQAAVVRGWAEINLFNLFSVTVDNTCGWLIHKGRRFCFALFPPCGSGCWEGVTNCLSSSLCHMLYQLVYRNDWSHHESRSKRARQGCHIQIVIACSEGNLSSLEGTTIIPSWKQSPWHNCLPKIPLCFYTGCKS